MDFIRAVLLVLLFGSVPLSGMADDRAKSADPIAVLDKDQDLEKLLNTRLKQGIKPEENANVLLMQAIGPDLGLGLESSFPGSHFGWLEMPVLPLKGNYFIKLRSRLKNPNSAAEISRLSVPLIKAGMKTWKREEFPQLAEWIEANEKPLTMIVEGTRRPKYFDPVVVDYRPERSHTLMGATYSHNNLLRDEVARMLLARSMLRLGEGKTDAAWEDLLAFRRLARFVALGGRPGDCRFALSIDRISERAEMRFLEHDGVTSQQISRCLNDLQSLPPWEKGLELEEFSEPVIQLDFVRSIRRGEVELLDQLLVKNGKLTADEKKRLGGLFWNQIEKSVTAWHERRMKIVKIADRETRQQAHAEYIKELAALSKLAPEAISLRQITAENLAGLSPSRAVANWLVRYLSMTSYALEYVMIKQSMAQRDRNLRIAFALAAFRKDQQRYPEKLAELVPKYLNQIPLDAFNGEELVYRSKAEGCEFYSVGINGVDDHGQKDDQVIRLGKKPVK